MARIRTIKPEFPQSESVGRLGRDARLTFVLLWTIVDDDGRARAASRMLASLLFPYDDDAPAQIEGWLQEVEREGFIKRYQVNGSAYLQIENWRKHQKIDHPTASKLPPPPESDDFAKARESSLSLAPEVEVERDQDQEGTGRGARDGAPAALIADLSLHDQCKRLVGQEPCLVATDFHVVQDLLGQEGVTEVDVLAGIEAALRAGDPKFKFRAWKSFKGWILGAAKDRLGGQPRKQFGAAALKPADPPSEKINLKGNMIPVSEVVKKLGDANFPASWPKFYGDPPPSSGCQVPKRLWPKHLLPEPTAA